MIGPGAISVVVSFRKRAGILFVPINSFRMVKLLSILVGLILMDLMSVVEICPKFGRLDMFTVVKADEKYECCYQSDFLQFYKI